MRVKSRMKIANGTFHPPTVMVKVFGRVPLELTSAA
jgi:hypothetical protein